MSRPSITLTRGLGVEGDAHYGSFVRLGENIATIGLDLECLPLGTVLRLDDSAIRMPACLKRRSRSGTAEKGRIRGKYLDLKWLPRHSSMSFP